MSEIAASEMKTSEMKESEIKCLLFDNDGTLVDSEFLGSLGLEYKLREINIEIDARILAVEYKGWKLADLLNVLARRHGFEVDEKFIAEYRDVVGELFRQRLQAVEGVEYVLEALPHPRAVVSNGPLEKIRQTLAITGLEKYFAENIFSGYDKGVWKPDPGLHLAAAESMGYKVSECAVIEDSITGVEAGVRAGMKTFFYNPLKEPCEFESVISFTSMFQLPGLIAGA